MTSKERLQQVIDIYIPQDLPDRGALVRNLEIILDTAKAEGVTETMQQIRESL